MKRLLMFTVPVCLLLAFCLTVMFSKTDLGTVVMAEELEGGRTYLLSYDGNGVSFAVLDGDGTLAENRRLENGNDGCNLLPDYLAVTASGDAFFSVHSVQLDSNLVIGEAIYRAPAEGGLEAVYSLTHTVEDRLRRARIFDLRMRNGELMFFQRQTGKEAVDVLVMSENGEIEVRDVMYIPLNSRTVRYVEPNIAVYCMPDSKIWRSIGGGEPEPVYAGEYRPDGTHVINTMWQEDDDELYFSLITGETFHIDSAAGVYAPCESPADSAAAETVYKLSLPLLARRFLGFFVGLELSSLSLLLIAATVRRALRGRVTMVFKQAATLVPVIAAGTAAVFLLFRSYLTISFQGQAYERLFALGAATAEAIDAEALDGVDWCDPLGDSYYAELSDLLGAVYPAGLKASRLSGAAGFERQPYTYFELYAVRGGELYTAVIDGYIGRPVESLRKRGEFYDRMPDLLVGSSFLFGEWKATDGEWQVVMLPVFGADGSVVAVLECGVSKNAVRASVNGNMRRIAWLLVLFGASLALGVCVALSSSLRRLSKLTETVSQVGRGRYGLQAEVRGSDEVARIAEAVNGMSRKTQEVMDALRDINRSYFRFVPEKMLKLIGCSDIQKAGPGDRTEKSLALLLVRVGGDTRTIEARNAVFERLVPFVEEYGGVIEQYQGQGFIALFDGGSVEAGSAALKIANACGDGEEAVTMALHRAEVTLGIMGACGRLEARAVSEHIALLETLGAFGEKLGCTLILTRRAREEIASRGFSCGIRRLGMARHDGTEIELFDMYEADSYLSREGKSMGLKIFQKALEMFESGRILEARRLFIETLRGMNGDGTARAYLELCERRAADPDAEGNRWLVL